MKIVAVLIAAAFLAYAQYRGLFVAPADRMMGDVYRILFVHVPAAWMAMLFYFLSFIGSLLYFIPSMGVVRGRAGSPPDLSEDPAWLVRAKYDRFAHASAEVGLVMNGLALLLGSLWGKPVWGVWWTWDPRLTTTALLFIMYAGYLILRRLIDDPERRAKVSSIVGLLIFLNVPLVYLSVKWWRSLHQVQSSPETMAPSMVLTLRLSALAFLAVGLVLLIFRLRLAKKEDKLEASDQALPVGSAGGSGAARREPPLL